MALPSPLAELPSLSHFVIFNPTLRPPEPPSPKRPAKQDETDTSAEKAASTSTTSQPAGQERDKDLEDDLKEAAQILCYTSRSSKTVSRDTMLKQTGLVKGLMGFSDMLVPESILSIPAPSSDGQLAEENGRYLAIKTAKTRMIVWSPELNFYVYVNIKLSTTGQEFGRKEPSYNAQGLSDTVLITALRKGYEDFRLLHGRFSDLLPSSSTLKNLLERFFTRFAFDFENDIIAQPSSLQLSLPAHVKPDAHLVEGAKRPLEVWAEDFDLDAGTEFGLVTSTGPLYTTTDDAALLRYLSKLVVVTPTPLFESTQADGRATLGHGRREQGKERKTSWGMTMGVPTNLGSWVPSLPGLTPRSVTPVSITSNESAKKVGPSSRKGNKENAKGEAEAQEHKGRWGFSMPSMGLGETFGSVGGVFGLGGTAKASDVRAPAAPEVITTASVVATTEQRAGSKISTETPTPVVAAAEVGEEGPDDKGEETSSQPSAELLGRLSAQLDRATLAETASLVSQTTVDVDELHSAVEGSGEIELGWERRTVHLPTEGGWRSRRLSWIIRDNVLLFILHPVDAEAPYNLPTSRTTLALYSKLTSLLSSEQNATAVIPKASHSANSIITITEAQKEVSGQDIDPASSASLAELRDLLYRDDSIKEVYARTPASRFVVSKWIEDVDEKAKRTELHMLVDRKDASLTDAEHALRSFLRNRQPVAS